MNDIGCVNDTIITASGTYFDYRNPKIEQIEIFDIIKALSNICRFGGQIDFYSVAEHSIHCAILAEKKGYEKEVVYAALMHDAQEAYIGDMPKPLKRMLPAYQMLEANISNVLCKALNISTDYAAIIKVLDNQILKAEKLHFFPNDDCTWFGFNDIENVDIDFRCWTPKEAFDCFFAVFYSLVPNDKIE